MNKVVLPPLPDTQFALAFFDEGGMHDMNQSGYTADQLRARDLEVARVALEAAAQAAGPDDSYQDLWFAAKADAVKRIRALEVSHE